MMLETLANFGEFIAAIGVIISLVYLAVQVRHATNIAGVEVHQGFSQSFFGTLGEIAKDENLHRIYRRGIWEGQPLNEYENERLGMVLYQIFGSYSVVHQAAKVDPELVELSQVGWDQMFVRPYVRDWWKRHRINFVESFRNAIDKRMSELTKLERRPEASTN